MIKKIVYVVFLSCFALSAFASAYPSKTTATVSLSPRDNLLIATIIVNWDTRASDKIAVEWKAPKGSFCRDSRFSILRGNNVTHDVSWAYRTVVHQATSSKTVVCSGYWLAKIVNLNTKKILASAGYVVASTNNVTTSAS